MRLLDIAQSYLSEDPTDIAGVFIHRQFRALKPRGWEMRVVNPQELLYRELQGRGRHYPRESVRDGVRIWRPRFFWVPRWVNSDGFIYEWSYKAAVFRVLSAVTKDWLPDLIVGDWVVPGGYAAAQAAKRLRVPLVLRARGHDVEIMIRTSRQSKRRCAHYRAIVDAASRVVCQGDGLYRELKDSGLYDESKLVPLTNGLDTALFHPASFQEKSEARAELSLPGEARVVLWVGRWEHAKGSRELTEALERLLPEIPLLHFVCAGPNLDQPSKARLEAKSPRVHFFGPVEPHRIKQFYRASDVFVLPSYREGLPNALLEALACGLLAIATPVGGIPSVLRDGANGLVIEVRSATAIQAAVRAVADETEGVKAMRAAAVRTIAEKRYDLDSVAADIDNLFSECVARGRRG